MNHFRLGLMLLAAGASRRMGQPKLLLPWGDSSILGHLLQQWRGLSAEQILIVLPPHPAALQSELKQIGATDAAQVINPEPDRGMFSSVQTGAAWNGWSPSLTHWLVGLGDQPLVQSSTLDQLVTESRKQPGAIVQPARNGRPRHPIVFPANAFRALPRSTCESLKTHLANCGTERQTFEVDDPGLDFDLDYPADYETALQRRATPG